MMADEARNLSVGRSRSNATRDSIDTRPHSPSFSVSVCPSLCLSLSLYPDFTTVVAAAHATPVFDSTRFRPTPCEHGDATLDDTKTVTPTDAAISTTSTVMSTGSAPIAISTPVNFAAGPVSPPPLTLAAGPGPSHQEQPVTTSAAKVTSYPAVLKGRTAASPPNPNLVPSGKIPPPVPPRGTGQSRTTRSSEEHRGPGTATSTSSMTSSRGGTLPSTCSTPPPPFDDAVRSNDQTLASGGQLQQGAPTTILASSLSSAQSKQNKVVHHVTLTKTYHDAVSISDVHLESSGSGSGSGGRETKSSLSVESGGSSRGGGGLTWTPPAGSAEGSTPTWTEGTPSFTESSSSGDAGCPTTPIRGSHRQDDGGRIAATVEEALASLTTEMEILQHE
ncbi:PREDICTED: mucin-5AC-like isoform X2 [Eufriesea mexicana]|uniref:mucin-5AC-like isoform X2 n=1 Tax=Eufriesea mexicana TaxID=516756 RepID=UPI00083C3A39|nr:PREDICTED: mucin-5AC-like isoform X2 [Eufriesea mexicana]